MLQLENIPPEQMPEVVRIASELYAQDQELDAQAQERQATVDAAEEIGLPEVYLHRAATELHARRIEQTQNRLRRRHGLLALGGAGLLIGTATLLTLPHTMTPVTPAATRVIETGHTAIAPAFSAAAWKLNTNPGTQATVAFVNNTAVLHVQRFAPDATNHFTANFNTLDGNKNLAGVQTVSFRMHGTLPHARLFLENGNERWRSPMLAVEGQERLLHLDLSQFEHQTRADKNAPWQKVGYQPPEWIENLSFKTGWYVNDIQASGEVALSDLRFE